MKFSESFFIRLKGGLCRPIMVLSLYDEYMARKYENHEYLTPQEVAILLRCDVETLRRWRAKRIKLNFFPVSERIFLYKTIEVYAYMDSIEVKKITEPKAA